jgi:hypothetical protein
MSLSERIQQKPDRISGYDCSVGRLLNTLEGDELTALVEMLGTPEQRGWSQSEIYDALTAEGYEVGRQTINRHRAQGCRCFKAARA